ncbi:MAG TPA: polysaccharide biosynthesis protein [Bacillota bacterium]|nr:polysaccharide biosynthesis protein [Bacillota bacterium]
MSSHGTFIKGAAILAVAGVSVRFFGAAMRIVLAAIVGDEGIGLYQMAYPIYSSLLAISTAGIPVAISKLVAENIAYHDYREAGRVFRLALIILALTGLVITLLMVAGADFLAVAVVKEPRAVWPLWAISPAIFFVTIMSAFRGFFQGQQKMTPTALSQLLEQVVRVLVSLGLAVYLLPAGLEYAAAGAAFGAVAGGILGLALLLFIFWQSRPAFQELERRQSRHSPSAPGEIIRRIFTLAIPVTFGSLILPLITLIDLAVVPRQLQAAGFTAERATALYGQLTGMASSIIYFPNVVTIALGMSLVPAISEAYALNNHKAIVSRSAMAIKLTLLFSIPAALGLYILAEPVTVLLFNNAEAGRSLAFMSWSVIPLCIYVSTTGILQGLGRPIIPVLNMVYGGLVKTVMAWFLTPVQGLDVGGAALASVAGMGVAAVLNLYYVSRLTGWRFRPLELVLLPGIAVTFMSAAVYLLFNTLHSYLGGFLSPGTANGMATLAAIAAGILVYGLSLLLVGGLTREELSLVPVAGRHLVRLADRFKLIRR